MENILILYTIKNCQVVPDLYEKFYLYIFLHSGGKKNKQQFFNTLQKGELYGF